MAISGWGYQTYQFYEPEPICGAAPWSLVHGLAGHCGGFKKKKALVSRSGALRSIRSFWSHVGCQSHWCPKKNIQHATDVAWVQKMMLRRESNLGGPYLLHHIAIFSDKHHQTSLLSSLSWSSLVTLPYTIISSNIIALIWRNTKLQALPPRQLQTFLVAHLSFAGLAHHGGHVATGTRDGYVARPKRHALSALFPIKVITSSGSALSLASRNLSRILKMIDLWDGRIPGDVQPKYHTVSTFRNWMTLRGDHIQPLWRSWKLYKSHALFIRTMTSRLWSHQIS